MNSGLMLQGSASDIPIIKKNNNAIDQALRGRLKSPNVGYANNSNSSYVDIEEEEEKDKLKCSV
jgi:hypothetical protein